MRGARWLAVAVLVVAAGCSQDGGRGADVVAGPPAGFAATPRYLTRVTDDSATRSYRFETSVAADAPGAADDEEIQLLTGAFDGERTRVLLDLRNVAAATGTLDELPDGVTRDDLVIETIVGSDTMYMRAPYFKVLLANRPAGGFGPPGLGEMVQALADGWISVDLATLGDADPDRGAQALAGNRSLDPHAYLELVRSAGSVDDLGRDEIDDTPVFGLGAEVRFADLARLEGTHPVAIPEALLALTLPAEVWVDQQGLVRRVQVTQDMDLVAAALVDAGQVPARAAVEATTLTQTLDLWDYGSDSITVTSPTGAADMTQTFATLCAAVEALDDPQVPSPPTTDPALDQMLAELEQMYAELDATEPLPIPEEPALPEIPDLEVPEMPELPEIPEMPEPPDIPDMPEIPEIPPEVLEPPPTMPPPT